MKYPIVSLYCFHVVGLSIAAAFEPVINMEHEAIIGGFKCLYWLLKHAIAHQGNCNEPALGGPSLQEVENPWCWLLQFI